MQRTQHLTTKQQHDIPRNLNILNHPIRQVHDPLCKFVQYTDASDVVVPTLLLSNIGEEDAGDTTATEEVASTAVMNKSTTANPISAIILYLLCLLHLMQVQHQVLSRLILRLLNLSQLFSPSSPHLTSL